MERHRSHRPAHHRPQPPGIARHHRPHPRLYRAEAQLSSILAICFGITFGATNWFAMNCRTTGFD